MQALSKDIKLGKADEEYDDLAFSGEGLNAVESSRVNKIYDIYLDEDIKEPKYYRKIIHNMNTAQPNDTFRLWINTNGGLVDGALAIIEAMNTCQAEIVTIATGRVYSCGSIIALNSKKLAIQPTSRWMLHSASYGNGGKMHEVRDFFNYNNTELETLLRSTYKGFLSEKELNDLIQGKDFWFTSEEATKRYKKRINLLDKEYEEANKPKVKSKKPIST